MFATAQSVVSPSVQREATTRAAGSRLRAPRAASNRPPSGGRHAVAAARSSPGASPGRARSSRPTSRRRSPRRASRRRSARRSGAPRSGRGSSAACGAACGAARTTAPAARPGRGCPRTIAPTRGGGRGCSSAGGSTRPRSRLRAARRRRPPRSPGSASFIVSRNTPSASSRRTRSPVAAASSVRLASRADVPRVVVDEHADAALVEGGDELADPGHVAVEVELVPLVDPDHRVGVPEDDAVVAAELLDAFVEEPVGREASRRVVVERLVPQPRERDREAPARPRELRLFVGRAVVADPLDRLRAPAGSASRQAGQSAGSSGAARIFAPSSSSSGPRSGDGARQVDGAWRPGVARLLERQRHARDGSATSASVRRASSSTVAPS